MRPVSNRPVRLYETAETHKLEHPHDITKGNFRFRPIIDETRTYT